MRLIAAALFLLVPSIGHAQSPADRQSVEEIRKLFLDFNAAWERRDPAFIDAFYAHDSTGVFFFERRQLAGWPRVDTLYQNMFASAARGEVRSRFDILDVGARGDLGWLAANFRLEVIEASGDTTVDEGRQSLVFERRAGRWVVVHRHTSFQAPPGPQRRVALHVTPGPLWSPMDDTSGGPDAREIRARREASNVAIARHDTAGLGAAMTPEMVLVSSTSTHTVGRAAILTMFAEHFTALPDVTYRRTAEEVRIFAPWQMASERGTWTGSWTAPDGRISLRGSYSAKWRKVAVAWMLESEIFVPESCAGGSYCRTMSLSPTGNVKQQQDVELAAEQDGDRSPPRSAGILRALTPMSQARAAHSMTLLANGNVLVLGGMSGSARLSGTELYESARDRFVRLAPPATPRQSHQATRLPDGRVLITGGMDGSARYLDSVELFDPRTQTFVPAGRMTTPRSGHEAVLLDDGRVLLVGGVGTGWTFLASAEIYDPRTGRSAATGSMAEARESHVAVKLADGRVLVAGGHRGRGRAITISRTSETFDPANGRFTVGREMTIRRHKHDAVALPDGRALILGGADERDNLGAYTSTEFFTPGTGRFTEGPAMRLARYKLRGTSLLLDTRTLLLASGATQAEELDLVTGRSVIVDGAPRMAGQFAASVALGDGRVLITGGYGEGTGPRASAWIYEPESPRPAAPP